MDLNFLDIAVFFGFFIVVIGVSIFKSRKEKTSEDYFLAGRGLTWWLIGISIVAANISTEQFVGMAGQGARSIGLAVSNWQLYGSFGIVIIAFTLLPRFLKAGIYTMPEYLEYRYNSTARGIMALMTVVIYVAVLLVAVLYSGGITLKTIFNMKLTHGIWLIGLIAAIYTVWGGLKACAWADLFQGGALLVGGLVIFGLGLKACGGWNDFSTTNADKLHMVLPPDHPDLPWTGVISGMWIVLIYYCGLNQFIVQRNLAAKSLRDGQLGVIFAGALWLIVPFAIVMPGIMSATIYKSDMAVEADKDNVAVLEQYEAAATGQATDDALVVYAISDDWKQRFPDKAAEIEIHNEKISQIANEKDKETESKDLVGYKYDSAFPLIIKKLVPDGLRGFLFAAIAGAVTSSLASMLNSASTVFTMDVYNRMINRNASQKSLLLLGRVMTMLFVVAGCLLAPILDDPKLGGVFQYIQQFQGYIWPGVVAAFLFGMLIPTAPPLAGVAALLAGPIIYGMFQFFAPEVHFLIAVALTFNLVLVIMGLITFISPLKEPRKLPVREDLDIKTEPVVKILGVLVMAAVVVFIIIFW
jgi:SSS family solute:Na+ symporter